MGYRYLGRPLIISSTPPSKAESSMAPSRRYHQSTRSSREKERERRMRENSKVCRSETQHVCSVADAETQDLCYSLISNPSTPLAAPIRFKPKQSGIPRYTSIARSSSSPRPAPASSSPKLMHTRSLRRRLYEAAHEVPPPYSVYGSGTPTDDTQTTPPLAASPVVRSNVEEYRKRRREEERERKRGLAKVCPLFLDSFRRTDSWLQVLCQSLIAGSPDPSKQSPQSAIPRYTPQPGSVAPSDPNPASASTSSESTTTTTTTSASGSTHKSKAERKAERRAEKRAKHRTRLAQILDGASPKAVRAQLQAKADVRWAFRELGFDMGAYGYYE